MQVDVKPIRSRFAAAREHRTVVTDSATSEASWFVYLLRCADGTLYAGITTDVVRRCAQHNAGAASHYTRSRRPVVLAYQETQATRSLALKRELAIKALSRQAKEALIDLAGLDR